MDTAPTSEGLTGKIGVGRAAAAVSVPDAPPKAVSPLRRRGNASLTKSHYSNRVNGRVRYPKTRDTGNWRYLGQLLRTCLPLAIGDLTALIVSVLAAASIGLPWHLDEVVPWATIARGFLPTAVGLIMINAAVGLYPGVRLGLVEEIRRLSTSLAVLLMITAARMSMQSTYWTDRISFSIVTFAVALFLMPFFRSRLRKILGRFDWWGYPVLVCGDDAATVSVYQWLCDNRRLGLRPVGVVASPQGAEIDQDAPGYLGSWPDAQAIAERLHVYWAVMVHPVHSEVEADSLVAQHLGIIPHVLVVSELTGVPDHWNRHQMDEGLEGLMVEQHLLLPLPKIVKRGTDLFIVVTAGILLAPLLLAAAIAVKLTSRGPIFFGHERVGYGNTRFLAWKFRTMVADAEAALEQYLNEHPELLEEWAANQKLKNDPRITPVGRFMRKWSIDELPQLWNVLLGEMSAVGPRPIVPGEIPIYGEQFEIFCTVLPGITGLWQVCGRNNTSFDERIKLGLYYIHHWSPWLDAYLLARTVNTVLFTKGAY